MMMMMATKGMQQKPFNPSRGPYIPGGKPKPNFNGAYATASNPIPIPQGQGQTVAN
jgi:hypothetical protein